MNFCQDCGIKGGCMQTRRDVLGKRRRYQCPKCGRRWTTYEVPEELVDKYRKMRNIAPDRQHRLQQMSKTLEKLLAEEMSCD